MKQERFQDPDKFITSVETKAMELQKAGDKWDEIDTLEHVCYAVCNCYRAVVRPLRKRIGDPNNPLEMEELKEDLRIEFAELN